MANSLRVISPSADSDSLELNSTVEGIVPFRAPMKARQGIRCPTANASSSKQQRRGARFS